MTQSVRERAKIYTDALRSGRVYGGIEIANFIEELLDQPSPDLSKAVEALSNLNKALQRLPAGRNLAEIKVHAEILHYAREAYNSLKDKRG